MRVAILFVVCAMCASVRAAPLDDARRHYQRLEYDQALSLVDEARRTATDDRVRAEAWLLEGYVQVALGRDADAQRAFARALALDENVRPHDASPKLTAAFNQALDRRRARMGVTAKLDEVVAPPVAARGFDVTATLAPVVEGIGAQLDVRDVAGGVAAKLPMTRRPDGRWVAHVPSDFARAAATLRVRVEILDEGQPLRNEPPANASRDLQLPSFTAAIDVRSPLVGAELSVNGHVVGRVPLSAPIPVEPGRVHLALHRGADVVDDDLNVVPGQIATVSLNFRNDAARERLAITRYVLLGLGGALAITGGVLLGEAASSARDLEGAVKTEPGSGLPTTEFSSVRGFDSTGRAYQIAGIVACAVGGVMVVTGAALFALRPRKADKVSAALGLVRF